LQTSLTKGPDAQELVWWCESGARAFCKPLYARDRCAPDASGVNLSVFGGSFLTVRDQRAGSKG